LTILWTKCKRSSIYQYKRYQLPNKWSFRKKYMKTIWWMLFKVLCKYLKTSKLLSWIIKIIMILKP